MFENYRIVSHIHRYLEETFTNGLDYRLKEHAEKERPSAYIRHTVARPALMRTGIDVRGLLDSVHWEQFLPLLVIFVVAPIIALGVFNRAKTIPWILWITTMVLENIGLGFAWNWIHGYETLSPKPKPKSPKKKMRRSELKNTPEDESSDESFRYPGIVNISGTYCFMNSTLQAMASLTYLQPNIEAIHSRAEKYDVPTPVIDAFRDILIELNTPSPKSQPLRPDRLINAFSTSNDKSTRNALFYSREHQDSQEFFQLLSETIKNEARAVNEEATRDLGFGILSRRSNDGVYESSSFVMNRVFDGLTANRRSCVECGYTEAVMHFAFDNWQLVVPRMASCRLEDCLADYTRLELLEDCICRKCSMIATHRRLLAEAEKVTDSVAEGGASSSKKKRAREARKLETRVKAAIDEGRIEEDIKGVKMEKVFSRCSTRQSMIARPPPVLALHLSRSIQYGGSGVKNTCRVFYPEYLDLTPFTTSGELSTLPSAPISTPTPESSPSRSLPILTSVSHPHPHSLSITPILYRLAAVVCHYGTHSFGHYVAYRRKPKPPSDEHRFDPPRLKCVHNGCTCESCRYDNAKDQHGGGDANASLWLRISDESVDEVGIERVLAENSGVYMLYYERVVIPQQSLSSSISSADGWPAVTNGNTLSTARLGRNTPHSSEETITPANSAMHAKKGSFSPCTPEGSTPFEPRVIHRVHAGKSKSRSGTSTPSLSDISPSKSKILTNGDIHIAFKSPEETKIPNGDLHSTSADPRGKGLSTSLNGDQSLTSPDSLSHLQHHDTRTFLNNEAGFQRTTGLRA